MGEMNWSIIKLFYKYMYTLIIRSTVCPGHLINEEWRLSQSEDMTCDDATVSAD